MASVSSEISNVLNVSMELEEENEPNLSLGSFFEECEVFGKRKCTLCQMCICRKNYNLKRHLSTAHPNEFSRLENKESHLPKTSSSSKQNRKRKAKDYERNQIQRIDEALTIWIASDLQSFRSVESPAFR